MARMGIEGLELRGCQELKGVSSGYTVRPHASGMRRQSALHLAPDTNPNFQKCEQTTQVMTLVSGAKAAKADVAHAIDSRCPAVPDPTSQEGSQGIDHTLHRTQHDS